MTPHLVNLNNDANAIREAAKTISLAFSSDPLIRWLRPGARLWGDLEKGSLKWQCRRVQQAIHEHAMVRLVPVYRGDALMSKIESVSIKTSPVHDEKGSDFGAVAMLFRPVASYSFNISRLMGKIKMWLLNKLDPIEDEGASPERIAIMMSAHDASMKDLRRHVQPEHLWYLEIIAVRPCLHGQGLGGQLMRSLIELYGNQPIALECTDESNVDFYKKFGFEEIKRVRLEDSKEGSAPDAGVTLVLMLRRSSRP